MMDEKRLAEIEELWADTATLEKAARLRGHGVCAAIDPSTGFHICRFSAGRTGDHDWPGPPTWKKAQKGILR